MNDEEANRRVAYYLWGWALVALLAALSWYCTGATYAAPLLPGQSSCRAGYFVQEDMAGTYENAMMKIEIYPCGGSLVLWLNEYGEHQSVYFSGDRIPGGGVLAYGYMPDPKINAYLDGRQTLALKPAESGWLQAITITPDDRIDRVYRLRKTS